MATIPTLTTYPALTAPAIAQLNATSQYSALAGQAQVFSHVILTATQAISAATDTSVIWGGSPYDHDSMWAAGSPALLTVKTPGYWRITANLNWSIATNPVVTLRILHTAGVNNPAGAGTQFFWGTKTFTSITNGLGNPLMGQQIIAFPAAKVYIADTLAVRITSSLALSLTTAANSFGADYATFPDGGSWMTARLASFG